MCFHLCDLWKALSCFNMTVFPVHKTKSVKKWHYKLHVEELDCPAPGPDLNPVQPIWHELDRDCKPAQHQCPNSLRPCSDRHQTHSLTGMGPLLLVPKQRAPVKKKIHNNVFATTQCYIIQQGTALASQIVQEQIPGRLLFTLTFVMSLLNFYYLPGKCCKT